VARHEESADQRAKVVAAGHAMASWVRARRAVWATDPLPPPRTARPIVTQSAPIPAPPPPPAEPSVPMTARLAAASTAATEALEALKAPLDRAKAVVSSEAATDVIRASADRARDAAESLRDMLVRWVPRLVAALALVGIAVAAVRYAPPLLTMLSERTRTATTTASAPAAPATRRGMGGLKIDSTPPGARILVDGTDRGNTPIELDDIAPGKHVVTLESSVGTVQHTVTVTAGLVAEVNESIFAGFLTVYSPFEVSITEGTRAFRPDERGEIMLPSGKHNLKLSNRTLGFDETRTVELTPGQRLTISITPPQSTVSVTATEAAEVWLDNFKLGDTPLTDSPVTLGTHELIVRRAAGGERRFTITVTVKPYSLFVDFSRGT
jgi:hypothetical protein